MNSRSGEVEVEDLARRCRFVIGEEQSGVETQRVGGRRAVTREVSVAGKRKCGKDGRLCRVFADQRHCVICRYGRSNEFCFDLGLLKWLALRKRVPDAKKTVKSTSARGRRFEMPRMYADGA